MNLNSFSQHTEEIVSISNPVSRWDSIYRDLLYKQVLEKLNKELELKIEEQKQIILERNNTIKMLEDKINFYSEKDIILQQRIGIESKESKKLRTQVKIGKILLIGTSGIATYFFIKSL